MTPGPMLIFSILSPLENVMQSILDFFHGSVGLPWAWSIVALTILTRIVLVPLTVRQIHSMQALQAHAPEMKAIQQKYKGDRTKLNEELMKFYKENNINPAASCLPLLAQFPVFIALYFTLKHGTKHITGSWLHVVPNISDKATAHWSGFVLLAIYAGSQIASTYFMGTTMDKTQRTIMMFLPLVFLTVVSRFPTGLILYWMTTNLWTVGQGLVTRRLVPKAAKPGTLPAVPAGPKRSSRNPPKEEAAAGNGATAAAPAPKPPPSQPRRVKKKGQSQAVSAGDTEQVSVEATGETVGEAKWKALRDLERLAPGLDKAAVEFQVVSEGERGLLGVGYAPARVVATAAAVGRNGSDRPTRRRERRRDACARACRASCRRHGDRRARRGEGDRRRDLRQLQRRRARTADRQARPDDRCTAGDRERCGLPLRHAQVGDRRRSRLPGPAAPDARGDRRPQRRTRRPRRACAARADEPGGAQGRARASQGSPGGADGERGDGAESVCRRPPRLRTGSRRSSQLAG